MANLKGLAKDTAIYGLSSIVGRFLNYMLVPLYTHYMPKASGDYGVNTNMYAYTALVLVILTFGMETTLFRFANDEHEEPDTVFSTGFAIIGSLTALFLLLIFGFITPIADYTGYAEHPEYLLIMASVVSLDALQALPFSYLRFQHRGSTSSSSSCSARRPCSTSSSSTCFAQASSPSTSFPTCSGFAGTWTAASCDAWSPTRGRYSCWA